MKNELNKAYIALALVSFFWGTTYIAARIGAQGMPGLFVAGMRQFISGTLLAGYFLLRGHRIPSLSVLKQIGVQSIFLLCISNGLITWSMQYITGGLAAIIAALMPLFIVLFTVALTNNARITRLMLGGLLIGFTGIVIIFYDYLGDLRDQRFLIGVIMAVVATLSWSFGTVYGATHKPPIDILFNVGLQMWIAGAIMLLLCGVTGQYADLTTISVNSWLALGYLIVFGSLVAYSAFVFVIDKLPPTQVSIYAYINPVVAVVAGWLLLSEKLNLHMVAGTLVTLAGVYLVNREFRKFPRNTARS